MSDKKKILVVQSIHKSGIDLLDNNPNFEYEIVDDINPENLKKKNNRL